MQSGTSRGAVLCDELRREWKQLLEKNAEILAGAHLVEEPDLSVIDIPSMACNGTVPPIDLSTIATDWLKLDAQYLLPTTRVNGVGKRTTIAIPYDWSPESEVQATSDVRRHERIPAEVLPQYLTKLSALLKKVTAHTSASSAEDSNPFAELWDARRLKDDVGALPELRLQNAQSVKQESQDSFTGSLAAESSSSDRSDVMLSFTVYRADERLGRPRQSVEVLGSQSLHQLQQALYCVHDLAPGLSRESCANGNVRGGAGGGAGGSSESITRADAGVSAGANAGVFHRCSRDTPLLFINNTIYCQLCAIGDSTEPCGCAPVPCATASSSSSHGRHSTNTSTHAAGASFMGTPSSAAEPTAVRLQAWLRRYCKRRRSAQKSAQSANQSAARGASSEEGDAAQTQALAEAEVVLMHAPDPLPAKKSRKEVPVVARPYPPLPVLQRAQVTAGRGTAGGAAGTAAPHSRLKAFPVAAHGSAAGRASVVVPTVVISEEGGFSAANALPLGYFAQIREEVRRRGGAVPITCARSVRCDAVDWQLGVPYLYTHAGGCEHVLYLTNIQPCDASEGGVAAAYPKETFRARVLQRRCDVCDTLSAAFVVYGDRLAEASPTFFCEHCHHMLHYSVDGQLLYDDFHIFPYIHDA